MWRMHDVTRAVPDWPRARTRRPAARTRWIPVLVTLAWTVAGAVNPVIEIEEPVYTYEDARNGADPLWSVGSTCLVRWNGRVFASGLQTVPDVPPGSNCRWLLFGREAEGAPGAGNATGWRQLRAAVVGLTREPCPLAVLGDGSIFLSTCTPAGPGGGSNYRLQFVRFAATNIAGLRASLSPEWGNGVDFTDTTFRSVAVDAARGELAVCANGGQWGGRWVWIGADNVSSATGELRWPWEGGYERGQAVRITHASTLLREGTLHFCGISEIPEPVPAWNVFTQELTGHSTNLVSRRLYYAQAPNITRGLFEPWVLLANLDATAGTVTLGDLWVDAAGLVHIVWAEQAMDEHLQERIRFPGTQAYTLKYARVGRDAKVVTRTLTPAPTSGAKEIPTRPRFQVRPDQRIFVFYFVSGTNAQGTPIAENRVLEIAADGTPSVPVKVPLNHPLDRYYTATPRAGSPLSDTLDLLGSEAGKPFTIRYARVRLR